jgi:uncharacterized protein DUF6458
MGIGTSLFLIATGAILRWAVTEHVSGVNIHTVGLILLLVGVLGLIISLFWMMTATRRGDTVVTRDRYVEPPPRY